MSFLKGLAMAVQEEDQQAHEKYMFDEKIKEERKAMLLDLSAKRTSSTSGTKGKTSDPAKIKANARLLLNEGFSEDVVSKLMTTQDGEGLQTVVDEYNARKTEWQETNGTTSMSPEFFKTFAEGIVIEESTTGNYDLKDLQSKLGIKLSPEEEEILGGISWTEPGAISISPNPGVKPLKPGEIEQWTNVVGKSAEVELNTIKGRVNEVSGAILEVTERNGGSTPQALVPVLSWTEDRRAQIAEAQTKFAETKNPVYLLEAIGTLGFAADLYDYDNRLENAPVLKGIKAYMDKSAIEIGNMGAVPILASRELIRPGTIFHNQANTYVYVPNLQWLKDNQKLTGYIPESYKLFFGDSEETVSMTEVFGGRN